MVKELYYSLAMMWLFQLFMLWAIGMVMVDRHDRDATAMYTVWWCSLLLVTLANLITAVDGRRTIASLFGVRRLLAGLWMFLVWLVLVTCVHSLLLAWRHGWARPEKEAAIAIEETRRSQLETKVVESQHNLDRISGFRRYIREHPDFKLMPCVSKFSLTERVTRCPSLDGRAEFRTRSSGGKPPVEFGELIHDGMRVTRLRAFRRGVERNLPAHSVELLLNRLRDAETDSTLSLEDGRRKLDALGSESLTVNALGNVWLLLKESPAWILDTRFDGSWSFRAFKYLTSLVGLLILGWTLEPSYKRFTRWAGAGRSDADN